MKFKQLKITEITADKNIRSKISKESVEGLIKSIKETGILQPILVKQIAEGKYDLIAGFRRITAAIEAGLETVPCVIRDVSEEDREGVQLVENIQREDLNPMDEASAVKQLVEKFNVKDAAMALGKTPLYIDQRIKLLSLPTLIRQALKGRMISIGHGIVISRLTNTKSQTQLFKEIVSEKLSVKQAENQLERYAQRLSDVAFDTKQCKTCVHCGTNQGDFFDKDSQLKGECLDKDCFNKKIQDYIKEKKKVLKEKKIPVMTRDQYYEETNKWTDISGDYSEAKSVLGKKAVKNIIESGEDIAVVFDDDTGMERIVLSTSVYRSRKNKLARLKKHKENGGEGEPADDSRTLAKKANRIDETQRRFLIEKLEKKMTPEQLQRIVLEVMFGAESGTGTGVHEFFKEHGLTNKSDEDDTQNFSSRFESAVKISKVEKSKVLVGIMASARRYIAKHDTSYLVASAKEIGIDMSQFRIDEGYLKKFTKDDLVKVSKELKCSIPKDIQKKSKKDMIGYILERKTSNVPKELLKK